VKRSRSRKVGPVFTGICVVKREIGGKARIKGGNDMGGVGRKGQFIMNDITNANISKSGR